MPAQSACRTVNGDVVLLIDFDRQAVLRETAYRAHGHDWLAAAHAWEEYRAHYPNDIEGYVRGIGALCESSQTAEAEILAENGLQRFPGNRHLLIDQALICFYAGNWHEAKRRFACVRRNFPDDPVGYIRGAEAAANLGEGREVLSILEQGCNAKPEDHDLLRKAALSAEGIHYWDQAAALWSRLRKSTGAQDSQDGELRCLYHAGRFGDIDTIKADLAKLALPRPGSELTPAERASRFESLGGGSNRDDLWGYGCEFGYYQRALGLEPLHFLRWSSITSTGLLEGLRDGFAGISDPAKILFIQNDDPIWNLVHTQYRIRIDHTGMFKKDLSEEQAKRKLVTHMSYLRDNFFEDLENGEKIFVYRTFDHVMTDDQLLGMAAAIKAYGQAQFLYVRLAADARISRTVERVSDNLLIGYIDSFAPQEGDRLVSNHEGWERICELALEII